jgi:hypothetical protein
MLKIAMIGFIFFGIGLLCGRSYIVPKGKIITHVPIITFCADHYLAAKPGIVRNISVTCLP